MAINFIPNDPRVIGNLDAIHLEGGRARAVAQPIASTVTHVIKVVKGKKVLTPIRSCAEITVSFDRLHDFG